MKIIARSLSIAALGLIAAAPAAFANNVNELETNGTAVNNTLATAQALSGLDFTFNVNPNVFGNLPTTTIFGAGGRNDLDFYAFQANGGAAYFDIDNTSDILDTVVSLFDSSGTLLAFSDDADVVDPGSDATFDSFLGVYTLPSAGTYYVAVSAFPNLSSQLFNPNVRFVSNLLSPDNASGGITVLSATAGDSSFRESGIQFGLPYTLHITLQNPLAPVPEPGSIALFVGMASTSGMLLRRKRK